MLLWHMFFVVHVVCVCVFLLCIFGMCACVRVRTCARVRRGDAEGKGYRSA